MMETGIKKRRSRVIAFMLVLVMIMQNVVSVGAAMDDYSVFSGNFDDGYGDTSNDVPGDNTYGQEQGNGGDSDSFDSGNYDDLENNAGGSDDTGDSSQDTGAADDNNTGNTEGITNNAVQHMLNSTASQTVLQMAGADGTERTYIRYEVSVTNATEKPYAEFSTAEEAAAYDASYVADTSVKLVLPAALSYVQEYEETAGIAVYGNITDAAAELSDVDTASLAGYAGQVCVWSGQTLNVGETKTFVAYAEVEPDVTDLGAVTAAIYANGQYVSANWMNPELLAGNVTEDTVQDNTEELAALAASASQSVMQYVNEDESVDTYIRYQIHVENTSADTAVENAEVKLELPSTLSYGLYPGAADETEGITGDSQTLGWVIDSLEAQGQREFVCYALVEKDVTDEADITAVVSVNGQQVELGMLDEAGVELLGQNVTKKGSSALDEIIEQNKEKEDAESPLLGLVNKDEADIAAKGNLTGAHLLEPYLKPYKENGKTYDGIELSTYQSLNNGWITLSMHMEETEGNESAQFPIYYDAYISGTENTPKAAEEQGWLYYDLGALVATDGKNEFQEPLIITENQAGPIVNRKNPNEVLGDYIIDTDGMLLIRFSELVGGNRDTCTADLQFNAKYNLSQITEDTTIEINFGQDINKEIEIKPGLGITAGKEASDYDRVDGTFTFTVGLNVEVGTTSAITMTDTMGDYLEYVENSLGVVKLSDEADGQSTIIPSEQWSITPDGANKFTLVFTNGLEQGNYNIVYKAKLTQSSIDSTNGEFDSQFMSNKAVFTIGNNTDREYEVVGDAQYSHYWVQKSAGKFENGKIPWTIRVNSNAEHTTRGMTVTDTLQSYKLDYYQGLPVSVTKKYYDENNIQREESAALDWGTHIIAADDGRSWTYTIPETDPEKCEYIFTFYTTAQKPTGGSEAYSNEASFNGHSAMDFITVTDGAFGTGNVTKTGGEIISTADGRYKPWTTTITIPNGINSAIYTDTLYGPHVFNAPLSAVTTNSGGDGKFKEILVSGAKNPFKLTASTDKSFIIDFGDYSKADSPTVITITYFSKIRGNGSIINLAEINLDGSLVTDADRDQITEYNISKSGRFDTTKGLINWTVNLGSGFGSQPVTIKDTFQNQEYIAGSAKLVDRTGKAPYIFQGYPKVEGNTLIIQAILGDSSQTYTLTYQTRPISSTDGTTLVYSNQAKVYDSSNKEIATTDNVEVKVPNQVFDKSEVLKPTQDNEYKASYKLVVNDSGISYGNISTKYTIEDEMSSNMEMVTDSLRIYSGKLEVQEKIQELDRDYTFSYGEAAGKKKLTIEIPDAKNLDGTGKTFLVCYDVKIIRTQEGSGTEHATYENKATLTIDGKDIISETSNTVDILANSSAGGEYTDKYITIGKYAENGRTRLPGATFALYRKSDAGTIKLQGLEGTWEFLERKTIDRDEESEFFGTLYFGSKNNQDRPGYNFITGDELALVEEIAPEGYKLLREPFTFVISDSALHNNGIYAWGEEYRVVNEPYNLSATKTWEDNSNHDGKREQIWLQLYANGTEIDRVPAMVDLSENTWSYTWEKLIERDEQGELIDYVVKEGLWDGNKFTPLTAEELIAMGYTSNAFVSGENVQSGVSFEDGKAEIINTHELEKTAYGVKKVWDDDLNKSNNRPDSITLQLYQVIDGQKVQPAYETVQLNTETAATVSENGAIWTYQWTELPRYAKGGALITYVVEETVPTGYIQSPTPEVGAEETVITNKLNLYTNIQVEKKWVDNNDSAKIRPENVKVKLQKRIGNNDSWNDVGKVLTISESNHWKGEWKNLITRQDGHDVSYRVREVAVPEGYQVSYNPETADGAYSFEVVNTIETVSIKAIKIWEDSDNQDKVRPDNITFILKANGSEVEGERKTVGEKDGWTCTWENLDKYAEGDSANSVVYTVEEEITQDMLSAGYIHTVDGGVFDEESKVTVFTHTNSREIDTRDIFVKKVWQDSNDQDGIRPTAIYAELQANGRAVQGQVQIRLDDANNWGEGWQQGWTELPVNDAEGNKIEYQVAEVSHMINGQVTAGVPTGYKLLTSADEDYIEPDDGKFTLINTYTPATISKSVKKVWEDGEDADAMRKDSINVQLFKQTKGGEEVAVTTGGIKPGHQVLNENNGWSCTWENLPKFENGAEIIYSVKEGMIDENGIFQEEIPDGYTVAYDGNDGNGETTITNTHVYEKTSVRVTKKWVDKWLDFENNDKTRPESIKVILLADGVKVDEQKISKNSMITIGKEDIPWSYAWKDLPKNRNVGGIKTEITYTVAEILEQNQYQGSSVEIPGYEMEISNPLPSETYDFYYEITNTHKLEKVEKTVTKTWNDNKDQDDRRPDELKVALYWQTTADGEPELFVDPEGTIETVKTLTSNQAVEGSDGGQWSDSWTGLPKFYNKFEIKYSVREGKTVAGEDGKETFIPYTAEELKDLGYERISDEGAFEIKNYHETEKITVYFQKHWEDDSSADRPEKIEVQLMKERYNPDEKAYETVKVGNGAKEITGAGDVWVCYWENLPRMENGKEVRYFVEEVNLPAGYSYTVGSKAENKSNLTTGTNTNKEVTQVVVNKEWQDDNNRDSMRPEKIRYELYADGHIEDVIYVGEDENWSHVWPNLPVYREGTDKTEKIVYSVQETVVRNYEDPVVSDPVLAEDGSIVFTVTNTYEAETTSQTVTKEWQDDGNRDALREEASKALYVQLYANDVIYENEAPVKLADFTKGSGDDESKWTYTWDNLPKYYRDEEASVSKAIEYSVKEGFVDEEGVFTPCTDEQMTGLGYKKVSDTGDSMLIINRHENEVTEVRVKKKWEDNDNLDLLRRDIVIQLYSQTEDEQEKFVEEVTLKLGTLKHTWHNLPVYENGKRITYSVKEIMPNEIAGEYVGETAVKEPTEEENVWKFTITNKHDQIMIDKSVKKVWSDNEDQDKIRPEFIEVQLMADGKVVEEIGKVRLDEQNNWYHEWNNLPKNKVVEGKAAEIQYTVEELNVPDGYEETITENESKTGFVIENKHQTDKTGYSVMKYWVDNNDPERPKEVKFQLYANKYNKKNDSWKKEAVDKPAAFTGKGNTWSYTWKNLDVMSDGKEIEYSVEEVDAAEGYVVTYDRQDTMTIATNIKTTTEFSKTDITGTKELAGATLQVWSGDGRIMIEEWKSTTTPHIIRGKLEAGKQYILKEALAPAGYAIADPVTFLVNSDGRIQTVVMKDAKTNISILKVDDQKKPLAGAELAIKDSKGAIIEQWTSTDKAHVIEGKLVVGEKYTLTEVKAPLTYILAKDIAFTVPANGIVELTMVDSQEEALGKISATKKVSVLDRDGVDIVEHKVAKDVTYYMALFKDTEGKERYTEYDVKEVVVKKDTSVSEAVVWDKLPSGIYYVFETDKNGTAIPLSVQQTGKDDAGDTYRYSCIVADGTTNKVELAMQQKVVEGKVNLENVYWDMPSGFSYEGEINISKKVLKNGKSYNTNTEFYATIFTKDENGDLKPQMFIDQDNILSPGTVKLVNNDTVTVKVPLGGANKDGAEPITYYVRETDENGEFEGMDPDVFAYEISGEGQVTLTQESTRGTVTITNTVKDNTMELDILKVDENNNPLAGADFIMIYNKANVTAGNWSSTTTARTLTLIPGTYTLSEVQAPTGYIKGSDATITIAEDGTVKVSGNSVSYKNGVVRYVNKKGTAASESAGIKTTTRPGVSSTSNGLTNTVYKASSVKTGDETPIALYLMFLLGTAAIAGLIIFIKKRRSTK